MITVCLLGANANISLWYRLLIIASVIIWAIPDMCVLIAFSVYLIFIWLLNNKT